MTRVAAAAVAMVLATSGARAHGLDEYVQATRVDVSGDGITLYVGLTPGVEVADGIIGHLDSDGDGAISPSEAEAYGRAFIRDVILESDGATLTLSLRTVDVPPPGELREGAGTIRIEATAATTLAAGPHELVFENRHRSAQSVYIANALLPDIDAITIGRQQRDARQQVLTLDFHVARQSPSFAWLTGGAALLLLHAGWRTRRTNAAILKG
jgi:hypothetical protein